MLKRSALRRIMVSTIALIIVTILYFFPTNEEYTPLAQNIEYVSVDETPIYLVNPDSYVVRTNIATNSKDKISLAKELIDALTEGSDKKDYISEHFSQVIPKNTKLLDISLDQGLLKLNFFFFFLNIDKNM